MAVIHGRFNSAVIVVDVVVVGAGLSVVSVIGCWFLVLGQNQCYLHKLRQLYVANVVQMTRVEGKCRQSRQCQNSH